MIPPLIREKHGRCLYRDSDGLIARTARLCPVFQRILTKKTQSKSDSSSDPAPRLSVWHDVFFRFFLTASDRKAVAVHSAPKYNTFWRLFSKNVKRVRKRWIFVFDRWIRTLGFYDHTLHSYASSMLHHSSVRYNIFPNGNSQCYFSKSIQEFLLFFLNVSLV